jgi:hypothetical protein
MIDPLQLAAWREDIERARLKAAKYKERAEQAVTAKAKLRLQNLAASASNSADRLEEFVAGRIKADRVVGEMAGSGPSLYSTLQSARRGRL